METTLYENSFLLYENLILLCRYSNSYTTLNGYLKLHHININYINIREESMLTTAISYNNINIVKLLLKYGAILDITKGIFVKNKYILHRALDNNFTYDYNIIKIILDKYAFILNEQSSYTRNTLLHICIYNFNKSSTNENINEYMFNAIKLLLRYSANIYIKNSYGHNCIDICIYDIVRNIIDKYDYVKNGAYCVLKRYFKNVIYMPPNGFMYKRASLSWLAKVQLLP